MSGEEGGRRDPFVRPDRSAVVVSGGDGDGGGGGVSGRLVVHLGGITGCVSVQGGIGGGGGGGGGGEGEEEGRRPGSKWYFCQSLCVRT